MTNKSSQSPDPDHALITACRQGNTDAYEILVKKYQTRMFDIALRTIGNYQEAEEAVQDAFVSAFKNIRKFKGSARFSTWLTRIVINMSRNQIKKLSAKKRKNAESFTDYEQTPHGTITFDPVSKTPSAETTIERKQIDQQVQFCLDRIETDFREVLILKERQDFSYAEIGETLKIPLGTVKSRLFRARDMVRECLEKKFGDLSHVMS